MGRYLPFDTPVWIDDLIERIELERGMPGWIAPIELSLEHPLVAQGSRWTCFLCKMTFEARHVGIVMPFHGFEGEEPYWIAYHRKCSLKILGLSDKKGDSDA